jgi:hypothetical protein
MNLTDKSGIIIKTGAAQTLLEANPSREGFFLQNLSPSHSIWINDLGAASSGQGSIRIDPGHTFSTIEHYPVSQEAISILGNHGVQFTCREW